MQFADLPEDFEENYDFQEEAFCASRGGRHRPCWRLLWSCHPSAFAQTSANLIDPNHEASLTINKKLGDPADTGYQTLPGADGVNFTIERIDGVDLTTNDGWGELASMTPSNLQGNTVGYTTTITTQNGGVASISTTQNSEFKVGVYRITEQEKPGLSVAPPFLMTLPHSGSTGEWQYSQEVYPKNQSVVPTKKANDENATIGSDIGYEISAPVPASDLTTFKVTDALQNGLTLNENSATASTTLIDGQGAVIPGVGLVAGTDYTVSYSDNTLTVTFTDAGLTKLQDYRVGKPSLQVVVNFTALVNSIPEGGVITNEATIELPNGVVVDTTPGTQNPTSTLFGDLTITKTGSADGNLGGAHFQLFKCTENDGKWTVSGNALNVATAATGSPQNELVTPNSAESARVSTVTGYGVPMQSDTGAEGGVTVNEYCVIETAAPEGFMRNDVPQHVSRNVENRTLTVQVANHKESILGQLPATGAWGIALIFLIGLALLARGLYTSYRDGKATA
ncbi:SpaH/EbpB family LPXTG-anchored major pilin [Corynebacterium suicordis]|uniref:SpaH/EbpB family LPXTG-anchored major pilin n=1 Tax=uncultured Corynebacterium sp. TaxID=159447 RepID=UPI00259271BC|nr:SpaH/EbpB family LPXTG-anchored major pilin [uncultured Corynebacterium sp.]